MKFGLFCCIGMFIWIDTFGQIKFNPINILRYNDQFEYLRNDSNRSGLNRLKWIKLNKQTTISLGGELREQYQYFNNLNFGDLPPNAVKASVGQLWHRIMFHSHVHLNQKWRFFFQFNSTLRLFNPNPLTPEIDENQFSVHQAFMDYIPVNQWSFRIGRQELSYGNNRLLTFREGPNTRLTFDAVVAKFQTSKRKIDILAITPVKSNPLVFDDQSFKEFVWGIYATEYIIPKTLSLDYYVLQFNSQSRRYNFIGGKESRQSFGFRLFYNKKPISVELEGTYQLGTFNQQAIKAYALSGDFQYVIDHENSFIGGIAVNVISGDKNRFDQQLNTYNLLFSKPSYGLAAPIGSSNIINLNPFIRINPMQSLSLYAGVYLMKRQSSVDGTYTPAMAQVRPSPSNLFISNAQNIGTQYAFESVYTINPRLNLALDFAFFKAGNYVKETGKGLNTTYTAFKSTFKF